MKWITLPLIVVDVALNVTAQMLLKTGMSRIGPLGLEGFRAKIGAVLCSPYVWCGGVSLVTSMAVWLAVLSRAELTWAYPLTATSSFLVVTLIGWCGLHEAVGPLRVAGVVLICVGVAMVVKS